MLRRVSPVPRDQSYRSVPSDSPAENRSKLVCSDVPVERIAV